MIEQTVTLTHEAGLHARPAALFVKAANRFNSKITVVFGAKKADAKSILNIMGLNARQGATITISADGADEREAVQALSDLAASDFSTAE